ncbi:MAG TPA: SRPBCC family protein [Candidatus Saccharimonadales bacterium]|jgi:carbon monoxide dehydrogenase subunit G|nr:SRPBCC family protein [Candidatus Saccharimonadales bacterium]
MALRNEMTFQTAAPIDKVWAFLSDPCQVATCVPGAQMTEKVDDMTYRGSISVKVGPAVTDYDGEAQIVRLDGQRYEMEILGKGRDVRGKGSASMRMTAKLRTLPTGATEVAGVSEVNVVGILAQMGSRVMSEVSNIMLEQFTRNFQEKLQQDFTSAATFSSVPAAVPASPAKPIGGLSLAAKVFWTTIVGLFGRKSKS